MKKRFDPERGESALQKTEGQELQAKSSSSLQPPVIIIIVIMIIIVTITHLTALEGHIIIAK